MTYIEGPKCHIAGVLGGGNTNEGVMIIGIAPGKNEVRQGRCFVGESGRLLDAILKATGWSREKVYCTNLICTWHDEPDREELDACRPRLITEIKQYQPRLIVILGKIATEEFFHAIYPKKLFGTLQGGVFWVDNVLGSGHNCFVLPTFHPAAVLHGNEGASRFVVPIYRDLAKIKTVINNPQQYNSKVTYIVARSKTDAQAFLNSMDMRQDSYIAIDIETAQGKTDDEQLDIFNDRLLCIAVSDGQRTMVIPASCAAGLDWPAVQYTGHNINYDVNAVARFLSVRLRISHDTMLMSYALDERSGVHGLKFLAREYLGVGFYEEAAHTQAHARKGFGHVDLDVLYEYNARDAAYTARLAPILHQKMQEDNVLWPYNNIMIPIANVFADMQYRGIKIDTRRMNELELKWYQLWLQEQEALVRFGETLGAPTPFNPNSDKQLKHLIFDILGLRPPAHAEKRSAKTGVLSFDKTVREEMAGQHPFIDAYNDFAALNKVVVGYLLVIRGLIKLDGKLHIAHFQHKTVTGRTSAELMQTMPNPKYDRNARYKELREIVVPCDDDHVLLELDYSRAEMWWAVTYSHDENMLHDLQTGDPHSNTAAFAFGKELTAVTKQDRTDAKHVTFGKMYGRGEKALHKGELKHLTYADVVSFSTRWNKRYAQYMQWNANRRKEAMDRRELVSLMGRKRRFKLILQEDYKLLNEAVNFPIQSSASDTTLLSMIALAPLLAEYDSYMLLMIHDALVFEVSKKYLSEVVRIIKRTAERSFIEGMYPVPVEFAIGNNWGQTHELHDADLQKILDGKEVNV